MIELKNTRELMIDDFLADPDKTTAQLVLEHPVKREEVFRFDQPWETNRAGYQNIVKKPDGTYLMYYLASSYPIQPDGSKRFTRRAGVLTSTDGRTWVRPQLDISPEPGGNMISTMPEMYDDNFYVFYDTNPACPENERYKAITGDWGQFISVRVSADGFHFGPKRHFLTFQEHHCYFDSLNTVHWDPATKQYVAYVRGLHLGDDTFPPSADDPRVVRDVRVSYSKDFIEWTYPVLLKYQDGFGYQMYTNGVFRYDRAPKYLLGFPTRYINRSWTPCFEQMPGAEDRKTRDRGTAMTDAVFMSSRGTDDFYRFAETFMSAGPEKKHNWQYGDCYPCLGVIPYDNGDGSDPELSVFCMEKGNDDVDRLYRYSLRTDGFACYRAPYEAKTFVTKPFTFEGAMLEMNLRVSVFGSAYVTLTDNEGHTLTSTELFGDKIDRTVPFDGDLAAFAGKPVVMTVTLSDASLYSFRFR